MGFFFKDPILGFAEKYLLDLAKKRYIDQGHSLPDDMQQWSREARRAVYETRDDLLGQQGRALKEVRKRLAFDRHQFKAVIKETVRRALETIIAESRPDWYGEEKAYRPKILAAPLVVLKWRARSLVPGLLAERIQFKNLLPETHEAIADDAIARYFDGVVENLQSSQESLKCGVYSCVIAGTVKNDFYHIDDAEQVSRIDILILVDFDTSFDDKRERANKKEAVKYWVKEMLKGVGKRPDNRRFPTASWSLTDDQIEFLRNARL